MKYSNFMIDLETLSTTKDAPVVQIGVCAWQPYDPTEYVSDIPSLNLNVWPHKESKISFETVQWWMKQSPEAIQSVMLDNSDRRSPYRALKALCEFIQDHRVDGPANFWAMPPSFDLVILENLFHLCSCPGDIPWKYNETRDVRTLLDLAGIGKNDRVMPAIEHVAVEDARAQALTVNVALSRLGLRR